jgi:hypothetical protein
MAQGTTRGVPIDTDPLLAADSDLLVASQKATKAYADTKQSALGFTPENVANKATTFATVNDTLYPTVKAVNDQLTLIPFDPSKVIYFDDFIGGIFNLSANFNNPNGTAYLQLGNSRLNTLIDGNAFSDAKGVLSCETVTSTNSSGFLGALDMGVRVGDGDIIFENRIQIPTLSTSIERFEIRNGLDGRTSFIPINSILIVYSDNINSGKFQIVRRVGGVETTQDTGITVVANQWYKIRIEVSTAGISTFFINGVNVGNIGSLPTVGMGASFKWRKLTGTTNRNILIDYMYCKQTLNTPR